MPIYDEYGIPRRPVAPVPASAGYNPGVDPRPLAHEFSLGANTPIANEYLRTGYNPNVDYRVDSPEPRFSGVTGEWEAPLERELGPYARPAVVEESELSPIAQAQDGDYRTVGREPGVFYQQRDPVTGELFVTNVPSHTFRDEYDEPRGPIGPRERVELGAKEDFVQRYEPRDVGDDEFTKEAQAYLDRDESFMDRWMREGRKAFDGAMSEGQLNALYGQGLAASKEVEQVKAGLVPKAVTPSKKKAIRLSDTSSLIYDEGTGVHKVVDTSGKAIGEKVTLTPEQKIKRGKEARDIFNNSIKNLVLPQGSEGATAIINMQSLTEEAPKESRVKLFAEVLKEVPHSMQGILVNQFNEGVLGVSAGEAGFQSYEDLVGVFGAAPSKEDLAGVVVSAKDKGKNLRAGI